MAFIDAIPVNRITQSQSSFDTAAKRDRVRKEMSSKVKQSVNISRDTSMKIARQKLSNAVDAKLAYNRLGVYQDKKPSGLVLSVHA